MKIVLLLLSFQVVALDKHPIYSHILRVKPKISKTFAMKLSNLLYKYSTKYDTDPHISVAIGRQETGLRSISRKETIIQFNPAPVFITGYTDICMFQFHSKTIQYERLSAYKLYTSLDYCVEQHVKLLKKKMKICNKRLGKESWSCYHSVNDDARKYYVKLVRRYL